MEKCRAKRGFFSLRDCGEMAVKQCVSCSRPMCAKHLSPASGFTRCLDCDARSAEKAALGAKQPQQPQPPGQPLPPQPRGQPLPPPAQSDEALTDPTWPYRYRSRYYRSYSYSPFYFGSYYDPYYDDYDLRSFDSDMASRGPAAVPDESRTGFGDS